MKTDYGVDAPGVIRNLVVVGVLLLLAVCFMPQFTLGISISTYNWVLVFFTITGFILLLEAALMLLYSKLGKFRHRERMLNLYEWQGNEKVLDVGTGLGLLMIGAAKKLKTGKSTGIDIRNAQDLSNNTTEQVKKNIVIENVADKTEVLNQNITKTDFPDNSFDVVLSNLCLHNISSKIQRDDACHEIYRILKPNGTAVISDFKYTTAYMKAFKKLGMAVKKTGTSYIDTFPPLTIITAKKLL